MSRNPQNLKTVLLAENILEMPSNVINTSCYNVMDYKYRCYRDRDEFNNPYGSFLTKNLEFTVKASTLNGSMPFYRLMDENSSHPFSIIFDPVFNAYGRMTSFKDGIVLHGYVVDVLESCENEDANGDEQLEIKITIALNKISYLGMENMHELNITND